MYTIDGKKFLDGMAGLWNVNAGYGREELAKAAYDQMKELAMNSPKVKVFIEGKEIVKVITVPGKLVNIVIKG